MNQYNAFQKSNLVRNLAGLLRHIPPFQLDEILESAKKRAQGLPPNYDQLARELSEAKVKTLKDLFDQQVQTLLAKEFPRAAGMEETEFSKHLGHLRKDLIDSVPSLLSDVDFESGDVFILIVIPFEWVPLPAQLRRVEYGGRPGKIDDGVLGNLWTAPGIRQPDLPYLLVDVDTGVAFLEYEDSLKYIKRWGRSPLNVAEGVSLVLHYPQILETHAIVLLGTRCRSRPPVSIRTCSPHLRLDDSDDRPVLSCDPLEIERYEAGAASCFRRVSPSGYWYGRD